MTRLLEHLAGETGEREPREVDSPTDLKFVGPATCEAIDDAGFSAADIVEKDVSYSMLLEAGVNPGVAAKIRRFHSLSWSFDTDGDLDRRSQQVRGLQDDERAWVADSGIGGNEEADAGGERNEPDDLSAQTDEDADGEAEWVANASGDGDTILPEDADEDEADEEAAWVADANADDESMDAATADGSGDPLAAEAAWRERSKPTPLTDISGIGDTYSDRLAEAGVTSVRSLATASPELLSDVTGISEQQLRTWHQEASRIAD